MGIRTLLLIAFIWPTSLSVHGNTFEDNEKAIQGTWVIVQAELGGQRLPDVGLKGTKLILKEGRYQFQIDQGEYKLHLIEKMTAMDMMGKQGPNEGKTFLAIYELKDNTLKICYDLAGKVRPKIFKTEAGTRQFLVTYQRSSE